MKNPFWNCPKEIVLKVLKIILGIILFIFACGISYGACLKIANPPIGTRMQERYGDDNMGNINLMALTLCPDHRRNSPEVYRFKGGMHFKFCFVKSIDESLTF